LFLLHEAFFIGKIETKRRNFQMEKDISVAISEKMEKTMAVLRKELGSLKAGRANPHVLDRITVDYFGTPTPINQMANISTPEPRLLQITLWDASQLQAVEKAIMGSDIGIHPSNDGKCIRLLFPELTEERRKDLVKTARKLAEEAKVAIRSIRREGNDSIAKMKKNNEITEDDVKDLEKQVQKVTDEHIKQVDAVFAEKEKEIMQV
jgi:ribosome recycling factor